MNTNKILIVIVGLIIVGSAVFAAISTSQPVEISNSVINERSSAVTNNTSTSPPVTTSSDQTSDSSRIYTLADVATHNSITSCWSVINDNVYDLTSWITKHPGGERAILGLCGKDGSSNFDKKHGGEEQPTNTLINYKIGTLSK